MGEMSFPPDIRQWIAARLADGGYADEADYVLDLIRRDMRTAEDENAWVRAMIEEGLASGVLDAEPEDILDEIIAEDPDLRG